MKWIVLGLLASLLLAAACGVVSIPARATLAPAAGPLFEAHAPALTIVFNEVGSGNGQFHVKMPDGEVVNGEYRQGSAYVRPAGEDLKPGEFAITREDWVALYGRGDMVDGQINGAFAGAGDMGLRLRGEYVMDTMTRRGFGVAKDTKGNLYKLQIALPDY